MKVEATVALLTFNGEEFLEDLLSQLFKQKADKQFEVLVIDSGSTDRTLEIVKKFPRVRLHQIPNSEFQHGRTRNLAVKMAEGEFVLFLTQDAVPSHDGWLDGMLEPFAISEKVSCVFGKQIPRADCFATLKREVATVFSGLGPDNGIILHRKNAMTEKLGLTITFFSDVNSAVRKSTMAKIPFREINYAEDQALGADMLDAGYFKAYAPLGSASHSHNYKLKKYFKRKFDEAVGLRESLGYMPQVGSRELTVGTLRSTMGDWRFILRDRDYSAARKLHDMFWSPFYNFANRWASRTGSRSTEAEHQKHSLEAKLRDKKG